MMIEKFENRNGENSLLLWEMVYSIVCDIKQSTKVIILDNLTDLYLLRVDTQKISYYLDELIRIVKYKEILNI